MSVLETPRIYFNGHVSWDPITTNNTSNFYDETDAETVFPQVANKVQQFRQDAIAAVPGGNWNPHGTHRVQFYDASISGADLGAGLVQDDPFVQSPANFRGMLVDLEPYGSNSSQLFFDAITFGIDGGYRIAAPRRSRFIARYINFNRSVTGAIAGIASVIWQTSFAKEDGLRVDAFDSPALYALQQALRADDVLGLTVQWSAYQTYYYNTLSATNKDMPAIAQTLVAKLNEGGFQPNPARGTFVGVVGLWRRGEPMQEPGGRALLAQILPPPRNPIVASIHARLGSDSITLDLSNAISEVDAERKKKDFGDLTLQAVDADGTPAALGTLTYAQYDREAYMKTSGIVTLPLDPAVAKMASSADLRIIDATGKVWVAESPLRAIPLTPNLYMNQRDSNTARFQVYRRGAAAGAGVEVTVCMMSADSGTIASTFTAVTDADGMISFPVTGVKGGIVVYIPLPGPDPQVPSGGLVTQVNTYMYVRTLPADDHIAQLDPTWDNAYSRVLANWHGMAPCMDNWLNLGDQMQVRSFANLLFQLTDEASFENFMYMPVTRDMTPGERTLLYNFLNSPPPPPPKKEVMLTAAEPETKAHPNFSRGMKSE